MKSAEQMKAEIEKLERKAASCKFATARALHLERAEYLRKELTLQRLWEDAGSTQDRRSPASRSKEGSEGRPPLLQHLPPEGEQVRVLLIPEVLPPPPVAYHPVWPKLTGTDWAVAFILTVLTQAFGFSHWILLAGYFYYQKRNNT